MGGELSLDRQIDKFTIEKGNQPVIISFSNNELKVVQRLTVQCSLAQN